MDEPDIALRKVVFVFDAQQIPYLVGGSVASSLYGIPRLTRDIDLLAQLREEHIPPLVASWQEEFYADADLMREAIQRNECFNIIFLPTVYKVDIFIAGGGAWDEEQFARRRRYTFGEGATPFPVYVAGAETMVVQKLRWYVRGGSVSQRQWEDIRGILRVQAAALDIAYLRHWAAELGVNDLLEKAFAETGLS